MGAKQSKTLDAILHDIEADRQVDLHDMKKVFDSFDTNKSGFLERAEVDHFMEFLFDYVYSQNKPEEVMDMHFRNPLMKLAPMKMHMSRGVKPSAIEKSHFKKEVLALLDVDKDGRLSWEEFSTGVTQVLKDRIVNAPIPVAQPMSRPAPPTF